MAPGPSHKKAQGKAAGKRGKTEVLLRSGRKLDALSQSGKATEVERSGDGRSLNAAARRLKTAKAQNLAKSVELKVPNKDMDKASDAMRGQGVKGTVSNMGGSKRRRV